MFLKILDELKDYIISELNVFSNSGYVYYDEFDFIESGITDHYKNLFYLRVPGLGHTKYRLSLNNGVDVVSYDCRLVVQLNKSIDKDTAILSILKIIGSRWDLVLKSFSDDTEFIYVLETGKEATLREFNLLSFDFTVNEEFDLRNICKPDCLC